MLPSHEGVEQNMRHFGGSDPSASHRARCPSSAPLRGDPTLAPRAIRQ